MVFQVKINENLLQEERAQALGLDPGEIPSSAAPVKKPNASGNQYHSMVIGLDDSMSDMRKKLLEGDE